MSFLLTHLGELAALGAALCWVITSLAFAAAGRRIGATAVNFIRIFLALGALLCINRALFGQWMPAADTRSVILLAVSGLVGLSIGDQFLFTALVDVGPRMATLMMTLAPPVAALLAWPLLAEPLGSLQILGISVTVAGIAWVVLERPQVAREKHRRYPHPVRGVVFGALAGVCQATGLVLSKLGMGHVPGVEMAMVDPWTATLYRMIFAAAGITILVAAMRLVQRANQGNRMIEVSVEAEHLPARPGSRQVPFALLMVCIGVTFGPVLGVWNSMVAVDRAEAGVAATLMAMSPVFILPFAVWIEKERISWRAAIGAMIAVAGVSILTLANGTAGG